MDSRSNLWKPLCNVQGVCRTFAKFIWVNLDENIAIGTKVAAGIW